jgi:type IV secretory pathway protease TraF
MAGAEKSLEKSSFLSASGTADRPTARRKLSHVNGLATRGTAAFILGGRVIGHSEIFLMNPHEPASLDGRYFGPLPIASIAGLAEPLWTSAQDRS